MSVSLSFDLKIVDVVGVKNFGKSQLVSRQFGGVLKSGFGLLFSTPLVCAVLVRVVWVFCGFATTGSDEKRLEDRRPTGEIG